MNCLDCEHHKVISDADPEDWFCDDDEAVICMLTPNPNKDMSSKYKSDRSDFRCVSVSCRPYQTRRESETPKWCPLNKHKE